MLYSNYTSDHQSSLMDHRLPTAALNHYQEAQKGEISGKYITVAERIICPEMLRYI